MFPRRKSLSHRSALPRDRMAGRRLNRVAIVPPQQGMRARGVPPGSMTGVHTRFDPDSMTGVRARPPPVDMDVYDINTTLEGRLPGTTLSDLVKPETNYTVAPKNNFTKKLRRFVLLLLIVGGLVVGGIFLYNNLINNNSQSVEEKKFKFCTHLVYLHCLSRNKGPNFPQRIDTIKKEFNERFPDFGASYNDIERALKICKRPSPPSALATYASCSNKIKNCSGVSHGESRNPSNEVGYHRFEAELKHIDGSYDNRYACIYPEVDTGENFGKENAEFGTRGRGFEEEHQTGSVDQRGVDQW